MLDAEECRGATPRAWESVAEADDIPVVVKGPLTVTDNIMFVERMGWIVYPRARARSRLLQEAPGRE